MENKKPKYNSLKEWRKAEFRAYEYARVKGLLPKICQKTGWNMFKKPNSPNFWTLEKCKEKALKYSYKDEWCKFDKPSYSAAIRHNYFNECTKHMNQKYIKWKKETCVKIALNYFSKHEWRKYENPSYSAAIRNKWIDECTKHMRK